MQRDIIVVNNFYEKPDEVISYASNLPKYYPYKNQEDIIAGTDNADYMLI